MKNIFSVFPTYLYKSKLAPKSSALSNTSLLAAIEKIRKFDRQGELWSKANFPGGYTSYSSLSKLYELSSEFDNLRKRIDKHVRSFASSLAWEIETSNLQMTSMWINIVPEGCGHSLHLHPLAVISGTYYVQVSEKNAQIKFEDPRLSKFMAAPTRKATAPEFLKNFYFIKPKAGDVVLFESWLRHEVPQNTSSKTRISVSFNYEWVQSKS